MSSLGEGGRQHTLELPTTVWDTSLHTGELHPPGNTHTVTTNERGLPAPQESYNAAVQPSQRSGHVKSEVGKDGEEGCLLARNSILPEGSCGLLVPGNCFDFWSGLSTGHSKIIGKHRHELSSCTCIHTCMFVWYVCYM